MLSKEIKVFGKEKQASCSAWRGEGGREKWPIRHTQELGCVPRPGFKEQIPERNTRPDKQWKFLKACCFPPGENNLRNTTPPILHSSLR